MKLSFPLRSSACENTETIKPSKAWQIAPMIANFVKKFLEAGGPDRNVKGQNQPLWNSLVFKCLCLNYRQSGIPSLHQQFTKKHVTLTFACSCLAVHLQAEAHIRLFFDADVQSLNKLKMWQKFSIDTESNTRIWVMLTALWCNAVLRQITALRHCYKMLILVMTEVLFFFFGAIWSKM